MWKLIKLFSPILFLLLLSTDIKKEFDINVELVGTIKEEKPRLAPPERLAYEEAKPFDLSNILLEPPKSFEFAQVKPVQTSGTVISCGEPPDALSYRLGVDYYLKGDFKRAEEELKKVVSMPSSFKPMAEYILGAIYVKQGKEHDAIELFESSCKFSHMYSKASCESYYALKFMTKKTVLKNEDPLWRSVRALTLGQYVEPNCEGAIFSNYCAYVRDFYHGKINGDYKTSTELRSAIKLFQDKNLSVSETIFKRYEQPGKEYREVALYYLGLIEIEKGNVERGLYYASLLETINRELSKNLYNFLSSKGVIYARLAYSATKDPRFLEKAGVIAYNNGDYRIALSNFLEAGNYLHATYSAVKMGDYKTAIELARRISPKNKEQYIWLLESAYWLGYDLKPYLLEVQTVHPDLYREYLGWDYFRKEEWKKALDYLEDPYYRALALYNSKDYLSVIKTLEGRTDSASRLLKARAFLFMGEPKRARSFLTQNTDEERYLLGLSYFIEGDYERAYRNFESVSERSPYRPKALLKMGDALYNMGRVEKAKETYYAILKMYPETDYAKNATAALIGLGEKNLSEEELEKLIVDFLSKEPNNPYAEDLKYQLANIYLNRGKVQDARKLLIELLGTQSENKAILKLAETEEDLHKKTVMLYKVYKEGSQEEVEKARQALVEIFSKVGDKESLAELLYEGSVDEKAKAMGIYLDLGNLQRATEIADELMKLGYRKKDWEFDLTRLVYKTKNSVYLDYLLKSPDRDVRAEALYMSALDYLEKGDKKKALEDIVDIASNYRGTSVYNRAIMKGAEILISMNAKRDASCLLDRWDRSQATQEDNHKVLEMKKSLPRCEVR